MKPVGRELDALVAEKVMGLTKGLPSFTIQVDETIKHATLTLIPEYSTDIAAAFEVVRKIVKSDGDGVGVKIEHLDKEGCPDCLHECERCGELIDSEGTFEHCL